MTLFDLNATPDDGGGRTRGKPQVLIVETDGGSRGNPGHAGYGALVRDPASGAIVAEKAEYLGIVSNNVAEYSGLVAGLQLALDQDPDALIHVKMDSKLVVEQMSGRWKIKHEDMRALATKARSIVDPRRVRYEWIPRERNKDADRLSNEAMDAGQAGVDWQPAITPAPSTSAMPVIVERDPEPQADMAIGQTTGMQHSGDTGSTTGAQHSRAGTPTTEGAFPPDGTSPAQPEAQAQPGTAQQETAPQPGTTAEGASPSAATRLSEALLPEAVLPAAVLPAAVIAPTGKLHHIELWVEDLAAARGSLGWMLERLGYERRDEWDSGASWHGAVGYIVLESGPDVVGGGYERRRPGLNHLAFWAGPPAAVDAIVADAPDHGWSLMYADRHPYAGGSGHYAAYLENTAGFEVELVAATEIL